MVFLSFLGLVIMKCYWKELLKDISDVFHWETNRIWLWTNIVSELFLLRITCFIVNKNGGIFTNIYCMTNLQKTIKLSRSSDFTSWRESVSSTEWERLPASFPSTFSDASSSVLQVWHYTHSFLWKLPTPLRAGLKNGKLSLLTPMCNSHSVIIIWNIST